MIVHKCDICGKEIGVWFSITVNIGASRPETNVADLVGYQGTIELCKDCFPKKWTEKEKKYYY